MENYTDLHLANNVVSLDILAERDFQSQAFRKLSQFSKALKKLNKMIQLNVLDQEVKYILLKRYIILYKRLLSTEGDKLFVELTFGPEYKKILMQYEATKSSLESRYLNRNNSTKALPAEKVDSDKDVAVEKIEQGPLFKDQFVNCQQLYHALNAKRSILLLDTRPSQDFEMCRITYENCINIPEQCIRTGLSTHTLGMKLPESSRKLWDMRSKFDALVLLDWSYTPSDTFGGTKLEVLYSILTEWDTHDYTNREPVLLVGGYLELLETYPSVCTNPHIYLAQKNKELDDLLNVDVIEYPNESDSKVQTNSVFEEVKSADVEVNDADTVSTEAVGDNDRKTPVDDKAANVSSRLENVCDEQKLQIQKVIEEDRSDKLKKARATKPKKGTEIEEDSKENKKPNVPEINRSTKPSILPSSDQIPSVVPMTAGLNGLRNIRNTCYMNTVIQCLRYAPDVTSFFCDGAYSTFKIKKPAAIIHQLAALIRQTFAESGRTIVPLDFYEKICKLQPSFGMGAHEDCMEFFLFLLNHLAEDCLYQNTEKEVMTPLQIAWYNQFSGNNSPILDYFYHQIRITSHCSKCNYKAYKFEIENTFMLPTPDEDFNLSELMGDYLGDFCIPEYCCAYCKEPVLNTKNICHAPKVMVIVLKRYKTMISKGVPVIVKTHYKVSFEKQNFIVDGREYQLVAIAHHTGNMRAGHYTAVALTPQGWYEFNDEIVRPININDEKLKKNAYAFFYSLCDKEKEIDDTKLCDINANK